MASQNPNLFRNLDPIAGQIVDPIAFHNQSQLPFIHVMGPNEGLGGWEPRMKRPKEEVLEGSQVSSLDFFKIGAVSTGLGLSLDNPRSMGYSSSGDMGVVDDLLGRELQKMDAEMDGFIRLQGERLRKSILEKIQAKQFQTLSYFEEKFLQMIRDKDQQVQDITKKNMELEEQLRSLSYEVGMWQQQAKNSEDMISALQFKFQQVCNKDINNQNKNDHNREGYGESEVEDSAACFKGKGAIDFHLLCKEEVKESTGYCKVCGVNEMCMLLLPCRHLCLCKDCEVKLNFCPVCQSSKLFGVEIFM